MMTRIFSLFGILWLLADSALAQSLTKKAEGQFNHLAYAKAIDLYEQVLNGPASLTDDERRAAQAKLGYSYQQLRDMHNAERIFRDLLGSGDPPADYSPYYLNYAQALASNGKYREAQTAYEKYSALKATDKRGPSFSKLYRDVSNLTRSAGRYKVEFLSMNTRKPEFSPVRYKDGLVFVSAGNGGGGIKRVFAEESGPFLDLFYVPQASSLHGTAGKNKRKSRREALRPLGHDDYTAPTANDTRTTGYYGGPHLSLGYEDRPPSEAERFSRTLNTKYHEGPATFTQDGSRVIFTRNNYNDGHYGQSKDRVNKLKLYTATQTAGTWGKAEELPFNSDEYSTGHPALGKGPNGEPDQRLYFASDRPGGFGGTDIYVASWTNGKWGQPINLGKQINSKGNELFPFADEKGNLYFSSDGHPGLGKLDIFYAQLTDDGKQAKVVQNVGEPLNSAKDDFGIVTDGERRAGYFSSNRKNGGADDDLYRFGREGSVYACRQLTISVFDADSKEPLVNTVVAVDNAASNGQKQLKTDAGGLVQICLDVNSDFMFQASHDGYLDSKIGFSTKRLSDDQPSRLEIALAKPQEPETIALRGHVTTQTNHQPLAGVKVVLVSDCDGTSQETTTGPDGSYEFIVKPGCDYSLEALKDNMGTTGGRVAKDGTGTTELTMFRKGDIFQVDNIYYDLNKATIRPDAALELDKVAALLKKYPAMNIEMRSHTDSRATASYNKTLSTNRAKAAVAYLKAKGISPKRMIAKGYGESLPLNKCKDGVNCTEEEYQQNRRTEIKVVKLM